MKPGKKDIEQAQHITVRGVVSYLVGNRGLSSEEATNLFLRSKTYDALKDDSTGLFAESNAYVIEQFEHELAGNWDEWLRE